MQLGRQQLEHVPFRLPVQPLGRTPAVATIGLSDQLVISTSLQCLW